MKGYNVDPLPPDVEALLAVERRRPGPSAETRQRVLVGAVAASTASTVPTPAGAAPTATTAAAGLSGGAGLPAALGGVAKLLSGALVLATGVGVYSWVRHSEPRTAPQAIVSIDQSRNTGSAQPAQMADDPTQAPAPGPAAQPAPTRQRPRKSRVEPQGRVQVRGTAGNSNQLTLSAEQALLTQARSALAQSQPDAALAATQEHARRFPQGMLIEERETLAIRALVQAKRVKEARERGKHFRQEFPTSIYLPAVEQTLSSIP